MTSAVPKLQALPLAKVVRPTVYEHERTKNYHASLNQLLTSKPWAFRPIREPKPLNIAGIFTKRLTPRLGQVENLVCLFYISHTPAVALHYRALVNPNGKSQMITLSTVLNLTD
ncbi:uncharacterized protein N0V89_002677 [Didymosphaeria variabile]|uniref:Uncharacterized protein n=1 Tax=Didymosphaeria variabile TaxID=1932322 RepID=A0A9W8XUL4_9PLEO|nr:uncharacterized protein N0V89_002677 [Didymosphaeria variabile]KAJ4358098.1 hypothetical protein N0V89_002677 [Didymosphaeria variabile]